jgi:hypothetical protein
VRDPPHPCPGALLGESHAAAASTGKIELGACGDDVKVLNDTPLPYRVFMWRDGDAHRRCSIVVKATCRLSTQELCNQQEPLIVTEALGAGGLVEQMADVVPVRTGTSVVLRATVTRPLGISEKSVQASVQVGPLSKRIVAFGKRVWEKQGSAYRASDPEPFGGVPATLGYAFGGGPPGAFAMNPLGVGFIPDGESADGRPLPSLEDPARLIQAPTDRPAPAALDAVPASFESRSKYGGTCDEAWMRSQAPLPPKDFDERYFDAGQGGLVARPFLRGGEPIQLENLHSSVIATRVPRIPVRIDIARWRELPHLDLVVIDPNADRVSLTFRRTFDATAFGLSLPRATILLLSSTRIASVSDG